MSSSLQESDQVQEPIPEKRVRRTKEQIEADNAKSSLIVTKVSTREMLEIEDRKMVTGVFGYKGKPQGVARFGGMRKYKGEKLVPDEFTKKGHRCIVFVDGQTYTITKWMADWLNGLSIEDTDLNPCKTPGACKIIHMDQWTDLQAKGMLKEPRRESLYSFTPTARW